MSEQESEERQSDRVKPGPKMIDRLQSKASACEALAEASVNADQLDLVGALVETQIVHVTHQIETIASTIRGFARGENGDTARAEYQNTLDDMKTVLDDLCSVACQITEQLEKFGAA
jgi:hypothetical protein